MIKENNVVPLFGIPLCQTQIKPYEESERFQNVIKEFFLKEPQDRFVMNVSPKNEQYIDLAKKLGFHLVQHTYERDESKIF